MDADWCLQSDVFARFTGPIQAVLGDQVAAKAAVFKAMPEPVRIMYLQVWVEHLAGFAAGEKGVEHFVADCLCRDCTDKADGDG